MQEVQKEIKTMCDNFKKLRLQKGCPLETVSQDTGIRIELLKALEAGVSPSDFYAEDLIALCRYYDFYPIHAIFYSIL